MRESLPKMHTCVYCLALIFFNYEPISTKFCTNTAIYAAFGMNQNLMPLFDTNFIMRI